MTNATDVYELAGTAEFPANVIARASGAPAVPELDQPTPLDNEKVVVIPAAPSAQVAPTVMSEEHFAATLARIENRRGYWPPLALATVCAVIFIVLRVLPAGGMWSALGYLTAVLATALIGVVSLYAVSMIFNSQLGAFGTVLVRCVAIKTMLDLGTLPVSAMAGEVAGIVATFIMAAVLLRLMFGLDRLQLMIVLLINAFVRMVLIGLILGATMNARF